MSWVIRDKDALDGTCYIEILPGKYAGKCWTDGSVFFEEEHFGCLEHVIERHFPSYSHYAFNDINGWIWHKIIADLLQIASAIASGATTRDIRGAIRFTFVHSEERFLADESENLSALHETIMDFTNWLSNQLHDHDTISILGM